MNLKDMPDVLTADQVAEVLRISRRGTYEMIRQKQIPSIRIGRRVRVPKKALIEFLEPNVELP